MIAAVEAALALLGVLFLALVVRAALVTEASTAAPPEDLAAPYREGLHTAVRMQKVAQDLEQQIYTEAARHLDAPPTEGRL
jgi:hypothetical protein